MFFHAPPGPPDFPTTVLEEEEGVQQQQQVKGHLLDQETGQASVHVEALPTEKAKTPIEDDSSGSLFKEAAVAEIPVTESLQVSQAPMIVQSKPDASDSIAPGGMGEEDKSAPAGQGSFDSPSGCAGRGLFDCSEEEAGEGLFVSLEGAPAGRGMFDGQGFASHCEGQGLLDGQGAVSSRDRARPTGLQTAARKAVVERSNLLSAFPSSTAPPRQQLPPPRPLLPPAPSTSPPPLPPSPPPDTPSPTHRVMSMKGGVAGTVQFAGMATKTAPPPQRSAVTTWKKRLFGIGKDEPDKGGAAVSVRTEDRQNLLNEISSMGHAVLKRTNRLRSPGGTPVKEVCTNPPPDSTNSDMLQRALMTKFRSLHSTPLSHSRFTQHDYSTSLDFSNAWSDSQVFEDPDISASSVSGLATSRNDSSKISNNAHNGSTAV